jgi:hypothetical protein
VHEPALAADVGFVGFDLAPQVRRRPRAAMQVEDARA